MQLTKNKNAFVTGASRGIGKGIAITLAQNGANVAFTYRSSSEAAELLKKEIESHGVKALSIQCDCADMAATVQAVDDVKSAFDRIDIVVNNAGITQDNLLMRMTEESWDTVINTNLKGCFNVVKAVQRILLSQRSGSIINISSVVGKSGNAGQANYAASKAGINGFTKSVAKELGSRNIRCNAVAPGFIATEMTKKLDDKQLESWIANIPLKRSGTPADVANLVCFLGSDLSAYISGQVINVCGGMQT